KGGRPPECQRRRPARRLPVRVRHPPDDHAADRDGRGVRGAMKYTIVAVGQMRPPYVDDAEHYAKLLRGHARVEVVELKEDADVARRLPDRAHVVLLDVGGRTHDSP